MRMLPIVTLLALSLLVGCSLPAPRGGVADRTLIIQGRNSYGSVDVFGEGDAPVATFATSAFGLRYAAPVRGQEFRNLPEGWTRTVFDPNLGRRFELTPDTEFGELRQTRIACPLPLFIFFWIGAGLAIAMLGVRGGPNKGEFPFLISVFHLFTGLSWIAGWEQPYYAIYLALSIALVVIGVAAFGLMGRSRTRLAGRLAVGAVFVALSVFLWIVPDLQPNAGWASANSVELIVPQDERGRVLFRDADASVVHVDELAPAGPSRVVYYWPNDETPVDVVMGTWTVDLGDRP